MTRALSREELAAELEIPQRPCPRLLVAISRNQKGVSGTSPTIEEAIGAARQKGEAHPFLIRVPLDNLPLIV